MDVYESYKAEILNMKSPSDSFFRDFGSDYEARAIPFYGIGAGFLLCYWCLSISFFWLLLCVLLSELTNEKVADWLCLFFAVGFAQIFYSIFVKPYFLHKRNTYKKRITNLLSNYMKLVKNLDIESNVKLFDLIKLTKFEDGNREQYLFDESILVDYINELAQSASNGDVKSQVLLGMYYENDVGGKNYTEAAKWFRKAAEQGNEDARKALEELEKK